MVPFGPIAVSLMGEIMDAQAVKGSSLHVVDGLKYHTMCIKLKKINFVFS